MVGTNFIAALTCFSFLYCNNTINKKYYALKLLLQYNDKLSMYMLPSIREHAQVSH